MRLRRWTPSTRCLRAWQPSAPPWSDGVGRADNLRGAATPAPPRVVLRRALRALRAGHAHADPWMSRCVRRRRRAGRGHRPAPAAARGTCRFGNPRRAACPHSRGRRRWARLIRGSDRAGGGAAGRPGSGPVASGLVAMKRAPRVDQADRLRDPLEAVGAGLAQQDIVRLDLGEHVAGRVQRRGKARLADHEGRAARPLALEERAVASADVRSPPRGRRARWRAGARRGRGACRSSCSSGRGTAPASRSRARNGRPPGSRVLVHEHAVHVHQPCADSSSHS